MNKQMLLIHRDHLLRAGIPYRQVRRQLLELQDHHAELYREGQRRGLDASAAATWAAQQLGSLPEIAARTLSDGGKRSLWVRYPRLLPLLLPVLSYVGGVVAILCVMVGGVVLLDPAGVSQEAAVATALPGWLEPIYQSLRLFLLYVMTPLLSLLLIRQQLRRQLAPAWWMTGVFLLCLLGSSFSVMLIWPDPMTQTEGMLGGSLGRTWEFNNSGRLLCNLLLSYGVAGYWQRRQRRLLLG